MKNLYSIGICLALLFALSACDKDVHQDEQGLIVNFAMSNPDSIGDIHLWAYRPDGDLVKEFHFDDYKAFATSSLPLSGGDYVLIAATNVVTPFSVSHANTSSALPYEMLIFQLDDASASPIHAHYGVGKCTVNDKGITHTKVKMSRILAELQFTIKGVPDDIVKAEAKITNVAKSFFPYSSQLNPYTDVADLGSATPRGGGGVTPPSP